MHRLNTGRNLNVASAGIIVFLLAGAEFRSAGVAGLSWAIQYPGVIKAAVVVFWVWLVLAHWLTRIEGDYYKAWCATATSMGKGHKKVAGPSGPDRTSKQAKADLKKVSEHFRVPLPRVTTADRYEFLFRSSTTQPLGVYVVQSTSAEQSDEPGEIRRAAYVWNPKPASERIGFLELHWLHPDVLPRLLISNVDVFSRRILPWLSALATAGTLIANQFCDLSDIVAPFFEGGGLEPPAGS